MRGVTLLVGAASPIGSAVRRELDKRGCASVGTSRRAGESFIPLDVDDQHATRAMLGEIAPESVIYLATPDFIHHPEPTAITDAVDSLHSFVEAAASAGARKIVFASSAAVYGTQHPTARDEIGALDPETAYAKYKIAAEQTLERASGRLPLTVVALRIFNVYGPGLGASLINRMFVTDGEEPDVFRTADYVRDYIHVSDVATAFAKALETAGPSYTAVNVGSGVATDNLLLLAHPDARGRPVEPPAGFASYSVASTARSTEFLRFSPTISLAEALNAPDDFLR